MNLRWVLIGERCNLPQRPEWDSMTDAAWARSTWDGSRTKVSPAFSDARSKRALARLGLELRRPNRAAFNLLPPAPQGVPFDAQRAASIADLVRDSLPADRPILAAGGRVSVALGIVRKGNPLGDLYGEPIRLGKLTVVPIPHPSGLNLWWNDAKKVSKLKRRLTELLSRRETKHAS